MLAKGREKSLLRRHPWVFSGAVARMEGKASLGETIDIVDHQGKWLARGAYSPASQIRARVWTFDPSESIDIAFFSRRLQQAQKWRDWLAQKDGLDSYRLIAGDGALGQLHPFFFTYRNIAAIVNRTFRVQRLQGTN